MGRKTAERQVVVVEDGRIMPPETVRAQLGIENHSLVALTVHGDQFVITKLMEKP